MRQAPRLPAISILLTIISVTSAGEDLSNVIERGSIELGQKQLVPNIVIVSIVDAQTEEPIPRLAECGDVTLQGATSILLSFDETIHIAQLVSIPAGFYTLTVDVPDYEPESVSVEVPQSGNTILRVKLNLEDIVDGLQGRILDAVTGFRVDSSRVEISELEILNPVCNIGVYRFSSVPPGDFLVTASKEGYTPQSLRIRVNEGMVADADFRLTNDLLLPGKVKGTVTDFEGDPVAGTEVILNLGSCDSEVTTITDTDGTYSVASLPPGGVSIVFRVDGIVQGQRTIALDELEVAVVDLTLFEGGEGGRGCAIGPGPVLSGPPVLGDILTLFAIMALLWRSNRAARRGSSAKGAEKY